MAICLSLSPVIKSSHYLISWIPLSRRYLYQILASCVLRRPYTKCDFASPKLLANADTKSKLRFLKLGEMLTPDPIWQKRLADLVQPLPGPDCGGNAKAVRYALPLKFFEAPMDVAEKREMHREKLYRAVRHRDRAIVRARDFDKQHNLRMGRVQTTVSKAQ